MYGDYTSYQKWNTSKTSDLSLLAAAAGQAGVITPKSANHQLFIQKITYTPTVVAAQTVTFRDSAGTPVVIALVPASQATPYVADFGPKGYGLTVGKNLDVVNTAGPGAIIHIEAYEKASNGAITANSGTQ